MSKRNRQTYVPSLKIITTKDEKLEFLKIQKQILFHRSEAVNHVELGRQQESLLFQKLSKSLTEHGGDLNRYGFHPDELDFWDKSLLPNQIGVIPVQLEEKKVEKVEKKIDKEKSANNDS